MDLSERIARNYTVADLAEQVVSLASTLAGEAALTQDHLAVFDELHMGGRFATAEVAARLGVGEGSRVLDVGSGIGGPARSVAARTGARVSGVDLTPAHVAQARLLSARVGLDAVTDFQVGDATRLPFDAGGFDAAMMLFVGMNVDDKAGLFGEVRRVLRPGGRFVLYDPMRTGDAHPDLPVPWAADRSTSFLETPAAYRRLLDEAGLVVEDERDLIDAVRALAAAQQGGEVAGQQAVMGLKFGEGASTRFDNLVRAIRSGVVEARLLVAVAP